MRCRRNAPEVHRHACGCSKVAHVAERQAVVPASAGVGALAVSRRRCAGRAASPPGRARDDARVLATLRQRPLSLSPFAVECPVVPPSEYPLGVLEEDDRVLELDQAVDVTAFAWVKDLATARC